MAWGWRRVGVSGLVSVTLAGTWSGFGWAQDEVDRYWSKATQEASEVRQQQENHAVRSQDNSTAQGFSLTQGAQSLTAASYQMPLTGITGPAQEAPAATSLSGSVEMPRDAGAQMGLAGATQASQNPADSQQPTGNGASLRETAIQMAGVGGVSQDRQGSQQSFGSAGDGGAESRQIFGPPTGDVGTSSFGMTSESGSPRGATEPATGMSEQLQRLGVMGTGGVQADRSGAPQQNTLSVPSDVQGLLQGSQTGAGAPQMHSGGSGGSSATGESWTRTIQADQTAMHSGGSQNPSGSAQSMAGSMGNVSTAGAEVRQVAAPSGGGSGGGPGGGGSGGGHR